MDDKEKQIQAFLEAIKQNESSGGINTKHKTMTTGIHAGESALGKYGMTPNTIQEMLGRYPENPYSDLKDTDLTDLYKNETTGVIPEALKRSPLGVTGETARNLADYILKKQGEDPKRAIASWLMGHNKSPKRIEQDLERSPAAQEYVEKALPVYESKFPKVMDAVSPEDEDKDKNGR